MKTKDFIKMLQEKDPTGEGYIRFGDSNDAIIGCEVKEGYWDGMYSYYDKETRTWNKTTKGYKVDIRCITWEDVVWQYEGDMNKIKEKLRPDYSSYVDCENKLKTFWDNVEKEANYCRDFYEKINKEMFDRVMKKLEEGWTFWTLNKPGPVIMKGGAKWKKWLKRDSAVFGEIQVFERNEHLFDKTEKGKFILYKLKK